MTTERQDAANKLGNLWAAAYEDRPDAMGIDPATILVFVQLAEMLISFFSERCNKDHAELNDGLKNMKRGTLYYAVTRRRIKLEMRDVDWRNKWRRGNDRKMLDAAIKAVHLHEDETLQAMGQCLTYSS